ncbi:hypothetical protein HC931_06500 [Candidatus Gracilibacteria bacterium]|nr:hypothetical protein [Candidatus Gracilibacteria bacterium]NJM87676.1 hypothetical protein [Hydrococcus sp. RU_2_2]NJP19392.1 hypothetical protein [Hydrococcus sp. CRU_1_1]
MYRRFMPSPGKARKAFAIASILASSGTLQLVTPLLAQTTTSTAAGQSITNRATATYEDPNGTDLTTTSNTVTVTVAEVAGITVQGVDVVDLNGGSFSTGDTLEYIFEVTNVGNATSNIFIPGLSNLFAEGVNITGVTANLNPGDNTFEITIPNAGDETTPIAANGTILVKVTVQVTSTTPNAPLTVRLGNTVPPGPQNAQNIPDSSDGGPLLTDVRTVDDDPGSGATPNPGLPINGEREAANTQTVSLGTAVTPRALAKVLKTRTQYEPNTAAFNDDRITYRLDLEVQNTSPNAQFTPTALEGTLPQAQVTGATAPTGGKFILVADTIPTGSDLSPAAQFVPTAPADWTVVYSASPLATLPNAAAWTTTRPGTVNRIGWVYTGAASITPGTTTAATPSGFQFQVTTNLTSAGTVYNYAQAFGETVGDTTNGVVYDESGDQNPNNFNDNNTPVDPDGLGGTPDDGVSDPATQGIDTNNNNTGQGPLGELNQTPIGVTPTGGILNGPGGQPGATGPDGTQQTDFVNRTVTNFPAVPGPFDPAPITFQNTANNPGTGRLDNVVIKPIPPSQADFVADNVAGNQTDRNTGYGTNAALPSGTTVTITDTATSQAATYNWNGTAFTTTDTPIRFSNFAAGANRPYTVTVNLPGATASTQAFPIPIVAFVDQNNNNEFDRTAASPNVEPIFNLKIDRAYTGYLNLLKQSRILQGTGPAVPSGQGIFSIDPKFPAPGNIIEYRITYTNISTPPSTAVSGSTLLNANSVVINEDGTASGNTWVGSTTHESGTVAEPGTTVNYFNGGSNLGTAEPTSGQAVSRYVNNVGALSGGDTGAFTFRRKVNQAVTP